MLFTIESRQLTPKALLAASASRRQTVDAENAQRAILQYITAQRAQLISCVTPRAGRESIATMKKDEALFLVRVSASA